MGRRCTICDHTSRAAIDAASKTMKRSVVAARYGVTESALRRHADHADVIEPADDALVKIHECLERLESLEARIAAILQVAQADGDAHTALAAVSSFTRVLGEVRSNLSLIARMHPPEQKRKGSDVLTSPGWTRLRSVLDDALAPYAEAKQAVITRLEEMTR